MLSQEAQNCFDFLKVVTFDRDARLYQQVTSVTPGPGTHPNIRLNHG